MTTGIKRMGRQLTGGLALMMITFGLVAGAAAEAPSRYDVIYSDMLEPMELESSIMEIHLFEGYLIVAEQVVLLVEDEDVPPPVRRTVINDHAGNPIKVQALKKGQRVLIRGLAHPSGQIIAVEMTLLKQDRPAGRK
jgi:hypothetical protein